ncbi:MAG: cytochrome c [Burkholderiales bacterium]
MKRALIRIALVLLGFGLLGVALVRWLNERGEDPIIGATPPATPELIARGAYLARAGNCMGCHTVQGGAAYAGGRGVPTPFGTIYAPNLTPDAATGIGAWSSAEFWRALHNGRARDGRLLYPAFPYPNYTRITREDSDAIHAYLRSLPAVAQPNKPHALSFPFDQQAALAVWRALYFRAAEPARPEVDAVLGSTRGPEWLRGAYLVEGLGHCNACHASRNALGATRSTLDLAGGLIPVQNWYAPSLTSPSEASVAAWDTEHIVDLMHSGISARGAVMGPMREVVAGSTQYLSEPDLRAMAVYLKALPQTAAEPAPKEAAASPAIDSPGGKLYTQHCVACHGEQGEGVAGVYPALAGSRAVTMRTPVNLVHMVLEGGFPPSTGANPRPYGMPPFATVLSNDEVAQLLSYVRGSWGNRGAPVSALEVTQFRSVK